MKNYRDSDYALNKYSDGIVYRFVDGIVEITLETYLRENPDKTESDFMELKAISDEVYLEQIRQETAQGRKLIHLQDVEDNEQGLSISLEEIYMENEDKQRVMQATEKLFLAGSLTEKQKRRFIQHFFIGLSLRRIAEMESVHFTSIKESISQATNKLKRYFENL